MVCTMARMGGEEDGEPTAADERDTEWGCMDCECCVGTGECRCAVGMAVELPLLPGDTVPGIDVGIAGCVMGRGA